MKKRIIAILLSVAVLCGTFAFPKRAQASAMAIGVGIYNLAWQILGIMTGRYDGAIDGIRNDISAYEDYFSSHDSAIFGKSESQFVQDWRAGWELISDTLFDWNDSGELLTEAGHIKLTYEQYMSIYGKLLSTIQPDINLKSTYKYSFYNFSSGVNMSLAAFPVYDLLAQISPGVSASRSFTAVYYSKNEIIFSPLNFFLSFTGNKYNISDLFSIRQVDSSLSCNSQIYYYGHVIPSDMTFEDYCYQYSILLSLDLNSLSFSFWGGLNEFSSDYVFKFDGNSVTSVPYTDVDFSTLHPSLLALDCDFCDFLLSLKGYTASEAPSGVLDDLSNILPTEKNPSLSIPLNPDLDKPLEDQVVVGDIDGVEDKPLADYLVEDFEIPQKTNSELLKKFPFCIPYDFVRFLGVLAADPVPPVFHIPISTSPENLAQWADNETVGQYVAPDNPMFEIDEEITLDFAHIPLVQPICYTVFIVGFVFLLLHVTSKFIQH